MKKTSLNQVIYDWKESVNNEQAINVVFLDLKRAFETVDRQKMLSKLESYGIKNTELKLFENYLNDRKQKVKFKYNTSNEIYVPIAYKYASVVSVRRNPCLL